MGELSRALGLGGRSRRPGDDTERARKAVTARIHHVIDHLQRCHPTRPPVSAPLSAPGQPARISLPKPSTGICNHPTAALGRPGYER